MNRMVGGDVVCLAQSATFSHSPESPAHASAASRGDSHARLPADDWARTMSNLFANEAENAKVRKHPFLIVFFNLCALSERGA